jgi:hypothetical protein
MENIAGIGTHLSPHILVVQPFPILQNRPPSLGHVSQLYPSMQMMDYYPTGPQERSYSDSISSLIFLQQGCPGPTKVATIVWLAMLY